jgi:glutathione-regulated potassium-efflux system ancillary protein KefG
LWLGTANARLGGVAPQIDSEDLIDVVGVAEILSLSNRSTVSTYQKRYPDMPRPVIDLGGGRTRLWSRREMLAWATATGRVRTK